MSIAEKMELVCIPLFGLMFWVFSPVLPGEIGVGGLLTGSAVLLLLQSLIRDLWLLSQVNRRSGIESRRTSRCICVESVLGAVGVGIRLITVGADIGGFVEMTGSCWSLVIMTVMSVGFVIKDYVLEINPFRIRKDKNHIDTVVRWRWK